MLETEMWLNMVQCKHVGLAIGDTQTTLMFKRES